MLRRLVGGRMRQRAWPTARGELRSALASAPYVLTLPQGMAEHTCEKQTGQLRAGQQQVHTLP